MEDEEFVPQNSDLRNYLESLNFYETLEDNTVKQRVCDLSSAKVPKEKCETSLECIDKDVVEQIQELLSARMLFDEDVVNIERLLSNFKVVHVGMLRSIFENVSGFIVIVLGLCVYWAIGSYVFFLISIYYAYNAADYLWKKHFNQTRLKNLTKVLQANYNLFKKTLKFIKDSDAILKSEVNGKGNASDFDNHYELYGNLKNEFVQVENETIKILMKATKKLIFKFPFYDCIENPKNYLCIKYDEEFSQCLDATKLFQIYLLVQSEFLQRLTLSLIPNIKISGSNNNLEVYKIIKETSVFLKELESRFEKKFKYIYMRGICDSENNDSFYSSKRKISNLPCMNEYKRELVSNIQDMSNVFQRLLIKSRTMEINFSNGDKPENVENELAHIQNELNLCQRNINENIIVLKKISKQITNGEDVNVNEGIIGEIMPENGNSPIDLSDQEENMGEDEIFEAYFTGENTNEDDDFDLEDFVKKKVEAEYSTMVLQELRTKIAEKAKEREIREANIIPKKMGKLETDGNHDKQPDKSCDDCQSKTDENCNESITDDSTDERDFVSPVANVEDFGCSTFQLPSSSFLADICKAREKLIQSPVNEEHFCYSENEDSE